jgi:hypothetical protein
MPSPAYYAADSPGTATALEAIDATGAGLGWNITASATPFETSGGVNLPTDSGYGGYLGDAGNILVNGDLSAGSETGLGTATPTASCDDSDPSCVLPNDGTDTYPVSVPTNGSTENIFDSATGTGQGAVDIATGWWLFVPPEAQAGTYTETTTLTITSGP